MRWIVFGKDGAASERKDGQNGGLGLELSFAEWVHSPCSLGSLWDVPS